MSLTLISTLFACPESYKEYAQSWGTCVSMLTFLILIRSKMSFIWPIELHVDKGEEYGLVSKTVWVHWVDGHFMIEPVPDPFLFEY